MFSQLFLISTLLLVWISTVAIGAPVVEIIERIKAIEIPRIGSGDLTLNRRFLSGIPGLPQCTDIGFPTLLMSHCLDAKTIRARCSSTRDPVENKWTITTCPDDSTCMDFQALSSGIIKSEFDVFALCVDEDSLRKSKHDRSGVFCKTYELNGVAGKTVTLSFDIYDVNQKPASVSDIRFETGRCNTKKKYNTRSSKNSKISSKNIVVSKFLMPEEESSSPSFFQAMSGLEEIIMV
ncbi:hypothetical protein Glove_313g56 [Diversispora epigaea]|uniref:Uncharacterized protein n=1 Tax=Diversispora epigaea TaxID=1348612 RepID=A0A397HR06_9GLOM|nr:hypothetical protein Glove_313g56 [Diversispora epigaea]